MTRATCHPERPRYRKNGLCAVCHRRTPEGRAAWNAYQKRRFRERYHSDPQFRQRHLEAVRRSRSKQKGVHDDR